MDGGLAEALQQDKDTGCLGIVEARVVTNYNVIKKDVDVGYFVGVERCDDHVRILDQIAFGRDELQDEADLDDLCPVEGLASDSGLLLVLLLIGLLWLVSGRRHDVLLLDFRLSWHWHALWQARGGYLRMDLARNLLLVVQGVWEGLEGGLTRPILLNSFTVLKRYRLAVAHGVSLVMRLRLRR